LASADWARADGVGPTKNAEARIVEAASVRKYGGVFMAVNDRHCATEYRWAAANLGPVHRSELDAALGEDAFLVGVFDFAHFGDGVGEVDQ